jgi:replicative DNA helicase
LDAGENENYELEALRSNLETGKRTPKDRALGYMTPEEHQERTERLKNYDGPDKIVSLPEYLIRHESKADLTEIHFSDFERFDAKLGGLASGEITTVSGATGQGKTLFCESWLRSMMRLGSTGCFFSFEVSPLYLVDKMRVENPPLYLPALLEPMNPHWLADRIEEAVLKYHCEIFVLDHLHYLVDMSTRQNMSLNIGAFMRRLKSDIALRLNVALIVIAHQGQGEKKGLDEGPTLENIRDSSFIAQESDNVILISRRKDFMNSEMQSLPEEAKEKIALRMRVLPDPADPYRAGFATVQIAKARRKGTFRWPKLFQKSGLWMEEV